MYKLLLAITMSLSGCSLITKTKSKQINYNENFIVENISIKEDRILLKNIDVKELKTRFNKITLNELYKQNYNIISSKNNNKYINLTIHTIKLNEFKIYVNGPPVNVYSIAVKYTIENKDKNIKTNTEEINKESLSGLKTDVFETLYKQAINNVINKINIE